MFGPSWLGATSTYMPSLEYLMSAMETQFQRINSTFQAMRMYPCPYSIAVRSISYSQRFVKI